MSDSLVGRDGEFAVIEGFLDRIAAGPAGLVFEGEPGIGKTILWRAAVEAAEARGMRVLTCRCVESEAALSLGGLSDLVGPVFAEVAGSLVALRRRALDVALLLASPGDESFDWRAVGLGFLDVLVMLAQQSPVVVAVDDVQWLDISSANVVQMALRRLRATRVGFVATRRAGSDVRPSVEVGRVVGEGELQTVSLGSLSLGALHHLLRGRLGLELSRPELARMREVTGGNPFYALALGVELQQAHTQSAPRRALRVPSGLQDLLGARLRRLPTDVWEVLLYVSASPRPTVELLTEVCGEREQVLRALAVAAGGGVIDPDESPVRFTHPLLGSIVYQHAPVWKRRSVHQRLAGAVVEVEERARHLALAAAGPDGAVATLLETGSGEAAGRGATAAAAELLELAAELTPSDAELARARGLRAADSHRLAGDTRRAQAILDQLLAEVAHGRERADVLYAMATTLRSDPSAMFRLCTEALEHTGGDDRRLAQILTLRAWGRRLAGREVGSAVADADQALEAAERTGDPILIAAAIAQVAGAETWTGEITPGLLERGVKIEQQLPRPLEHYQSPLLTLARRLVGVGELDRARSIFAELERRAAERGDEATRGFVLWRLGSLEWFAGHWQEALELAAAAQELAEQAQLPVLRRWGAELHALVDTDLGLVEQARASVQAVLPAPQASMTELALLPVADVLGRIEFALGNLEAAALLLRAVFSPLLPEDRLYDPTNPPWDDLIETLIGLGELDEARLYLTRQEVQAERVRSPWARAVAARAHGLLALAEGDLATAFTSFERSLRELDDMPYPFERGRTLLALGAAQRRAKQMRLARQTLAQAQAVFEQLGARLWAERALAERTRISGRRAAYDELTSTERRVATLAAEGLSNKQIASALVVSTRTVEAHLYRVYRKLGVRSRSGLSRELAATDAGGSQQPKMQ